MLTIDEILSIVKQIEQHKKDAAMSWYSRRYQYDKRKREERSQPKRQLMRESDFLKLPKKLTDIYTVTWKPFTRDYFERRTTWYYLKGIKYVGDQYAHYEYPQHLLKRLTGVHWWNSSQREYLYKYNEQGELVVRAGMRQPESRFGLATFRKK